MNFFSFKKEKIIEPIVHEQEDFLTLYEGAHILLGCKNVTMYNKAIVLEATDCTFTSVAGKSKIQVLNNGVINENYTREDSLYGKRKKIA